MPPKTLLPMILDRGRAAALGAFDLVIDRPLDVNLHELLLHTQIDSILRSTLVTSHGGTRPSSRL
jgi:hypothetical protein